MTRATGPPPAAADPSAVGMCYQGRIMRPPDALDHATLRSRLSAQLAPGRDGPGWAATALVLGDGPHGPVVCFIHRAERPGDRWSGHMALPGGRRDPGDPDLATTARRETFEEVGLDLPEPTGRLADVGGPGRKRQVSTFVFCLDDQPPLDPDPHEVQDALWIPVASLLDPGAAVRHPWSGVVGFPGIRHGEQVIWGLTHRIVAAFVEALHLELPEPG
jgi:8-oxo-dGTP pyrophosphatase MutT (NUDIX family)